MASELQQAQMDLSHELNVAGITASVTTRTAANSINIILTPDAAARLAKILCEYNEELDISHNHRQPITRPPGKSDQLADAKYKNGERESYNSHLMDGQN